MAQRVTGADFKEQVLDAGLPVLVDFYSDSCVPCKKLAVVLAELEEELDGKLLIKKVNVNYEEALLQEYKVLSSPTVILFLGGAEKKRLSGAITKVNLNGILVGWI